METPKHRDIFLSQTIDQPSIKDVISKIIEINEHDKKIRALLKENYDSYYNPKPIKIYIDSYGGNVYQCFGLIGIMEKSETPIHTIVTGTAMSAGFLIAVSGHRRFCYDYSTLMYHQLSAAAWDNLKSIEENVDEFKRIQKIAENIVSSRTKINKKKLKEIYDMKHDWYITPDDAKEYGCIDEIL
jgi:ATP-dependent Clp protease protease subunit